VPIMFDRKVRAFPDLFVFLRWEVWLLAATQRSHVHLRQSPLATLEELDLKKSDSPNRHIAPAIVCDSDECTHLFQREKAFSVNSLLSPQRALFVNSPVSARNRG
jgi:hypothetical protein